MHQLGRQAIFVKLPAVVLPAVPAVVSVRVDGAGGRVRVVAIYLAIAVVHGTDKAAGAATLLLLAVAAHAVLAGVAALQAVAGLWPRLAAATRFAGTAKLLFLLVAPTAVALRLLALTLVLAVVLALRRWGGGRGVLGAGFAGRSLDLRRLTLACGGRTTVRGGVLGSSILSFAAAPTALACTGT